MQDSKFEPVHLPLLTRGAGLAGVHYVALRDGGLYPSPAMIDDLGIASPQCYIVEINKDARRLRLKRQDGGELLAARCGGIPTPRGNPRLRMVAKSLLQELGLPADITAMCRASGKTDFKGHIEIEMEYPESGSPTAPAGG